MKMTLTVLPIVATVGGVSYVALSTRHQALTPARSFAAKIWGGTYQNASSSGGGSDGSGGGVTVTNPAPSISGVSWNTTSGASPSLTISGSNFVEGATVTLLDTTAGWQTGAQSGVTPNATWMSASSIDVSSLQGYGNGSFVFQPNDAITVEVTNPDGQDAKYDTTYPGGAVSLTLSAPQTVQEGEPVNITGSVTNNGQGLANALVNLSATGGSLDPTGAYTDSNGNYVAQYTATTTGTYTLTASADGVSQSATVQVVAPQLTISVATPSYGAQVGQTYTVSGQLTLNGQPVSNQIVTLSATGTDNGGTLLQQTVQTDANGEFSTEWTAPSDAGSVQIDAASGQQTAQTEVTVVAPQITITTNAPSSGAVSDNTYTVSGQLTLGGQPVTNQTVTLSASAGTLGSTSVTTDSQGDFSTTWTAPGTAENVTLTASVGNDAQTDTVIVVEPEMNVAISLNGTSVLHEQASSNGTTQSESEPMISGETYDLTAQVTDDSGNPLPGQTVQMSVDQGTLSEASATTDANGDISFTWTPASTQGQTSVSAQLQLTVDGLTNTVSVTVYRPQFQLVVQNNGEPTLTGATYDLYIDVMADGQSVGNATVDVSASAGSLSASSTNVGSSGSNDAIQWTAPNTEQTVTLTAETPGGTGVYSTQEPVYQPQITLTTSAPSSGAAEGGSYTVSAQVTADGQNLGTSGYPLTVNFAANEGSVSPESVTQPDSSGDFTTNWTAPNSEGNAVITATVGTTSASLTEPVVGTTPEVVDSYSVEGSVLLVNGDTLYTAGTNQIFAYNANNGTPETTYNGLPYPPVWLGEVGGLFYEYGMENSGYGGYNDDNFEVATINSQTDGVDGFGYGSSDQNYSFTPLYAAALPGEIAYSNVYATENGSYVTMHYGLTLETTNYQYPNVSLTPPASTVTYGPYFGLAAVNGNFYTVFQSSLQSYSQTSHLDWAEISPGGAVLGKGMIGSVNQGAYSPPLRMLSWPKATVVSISRAVREIGF
ncbi:hypothetical protein FY534_07285 [Alicyclobacillus sp. TC]|nr:hypothetical protein FY534_07285 [Alicyclobacillus sp. TC]